MEEQSWIRGPIIGRGSTATVSLAIKSSGDFFAVKSSEFSSSEFLQREESILSKLSSPYIVKYIGSNVTTENDNKSMYNLQMEYVSGGSIHDLIKNSGGKLPEPATVSLAIKSSGDFFAVKSSEFSSSEFLQREESILSKLSSPYIVKYIGSNVTTENDNKSMYNLQMEYVSGGSIHDLIKNSGGKLPEPVIRSYTRQILKGLVYLHEQGIVHCDLKSQNVMIGGETAKIVDLGCAKTVVGEYENLEFSGTPAFMSPEVARGEEQSFPADVWALGCTVIEMATGSSPWPELNDVVAAIYKIGFSGESPVIPVWLSDKGQDFLKNCLKKDPKQRWNVQELLQHSFLDEEDEACNGLSSSSPSTVLDQGFWDLCETSRSRLVKRADQEDVFVNAWGDSLVPGDRIKKLAGDEPEWETDGWIDVRGEIEKRNEDEDENCVEATSLEEEEEEEVGGGFDENWIWDQEDSFFLEYSPENNINYFYSFNNLFQEDIILYYYDHLEYGFVVPKVNDDIINNKIHFFAHIYKFLFVLEIYFITIDRFDAVFDSYTGKCIVGIILRSNK
ncbi:PREDICTED: serine/threonine-protein kinase BCK1/SLK1/SSP31-like [Camelina sativa]|uniref:Serine/threonine-protein kinase BCK1/SLK1/SSP31-like n=1 Tax=Camelina sativa TaxID=90675 RepID=A0ABM1QIU2_CAMSA|nr:PREDICTED: serine/threonine-protein kinase BCK1/SLK1/SSP31-like [Camelina sativa]